MFHHLAKALVVLEHGPMSRTLLEQPMEDEGPDSDETSAGETSVGETSADETSADENTPELGRGFAESSASHPQPGSDWKPIVHNDIKPQNSKFLLNVIVLILILSTVFLGDEDFDTFSFYPTAKLGDFGNAFLYTPRESQEAVMVGGTRTYQPPDDTKGPWSNVYGVGACMFESVTLRAHLTSEIIASKKQKEKMKEDSTQEAGSQSPHSPIAEDTDIFDWNCGGRTPCSRRLELLILRCLETNVNDRITAHELFLETRRALSEVRHKLKKEYGPAARPAIDSEGKKKPSRLRRSHTFKLYYLGNEIGGMPYGNFISDASNPPYLNDDYFPELYKDELAPLRFPMRENFCCKMETEDLDHFRMPWETDEEWNKRERDWPAWPSDPDDNGIDESGIDLFEQEEPPSDADNAGNEWITDSAVERDMASERDKEEGAWEAESFYTQPEYYLARERVVEKLEEQRQADIRGERVLPPPAKRQKLTPTLDGPEETPAKDETEIEEIKKDEDDEGGEDDGDDGDDEDDEDDEGDEDDEDDEDNEGDEDDEGDGGDGDYEEDEEDDEDEED